jgi:hypothetical protein
MPLYLGPFGLWTYFAIGRTRFRDHSRQEKTADAEEPSWRGVFTGVTHCGSGCMLGDIAGSVFWPALIGDFAVAYLFGIVFQYFSIAPMRGLGLTDGLQAAVKADTLSIAAYEVGKFVWMALVYLILSHPHLTPRQPTYWFMMQIAMAIRFVTAYPMNKWLIERGLKEAM